MSETVAIVGANLAGGHTAHQLRRDGFDGRIVLVGAEPHLPYERPPLSKGVLVGTAEPESTEIWSSAEFDDAGIDVQLGTKVMELVAHERRVVLDGGSSFQADRVVLCAGARPRPLPLSGAGQTAVVELRDISDAVRLRDMLEPGVRVVVIGAGFIGAEVAASAIQRGCDVSMLEVAPLPLQRVLGPEVGALYADLHREHGVDVRLGVVIDEIVGDGRCRGVRLADTTEIPADVVVCGVGVVPAVELAEAAGITVGNGILVDEWCRTSIPEVLAAGDVAARPSSFVSGLVRLESWQNAQNQAIAAARSILGSRIPFDEVPWFWSDQYDVNLQVVGFPAVGDEVIWRGTPASFAATAFYLRDGTLCAAVGLNRPRDVRGALNLIQSRAPITAAALADESVDLRKLRTTAPAT